MGRDRNCRALLKSARVKVSTETLRDPKLLVEVHEWEKNASKNDPQINWEGRAVAREMSGIAVQEPKERLEHFLESKKVASLYLGDHRTGTLREVEARTITDYAIRLFESQPQREPSALDYDGRKRTSRATRR
jgi:hypothetical protein